MQTATYRRSYSECELWHHGYNSFNYLEKKFRQLRSNGAKSIESAELDSHSLFLSNFLFSSFFPHLFQPFLLFLSLFVTCFLFTNFQTWFFLCNPKRRQRTTAQASNVLRIKCHHRRKWGRRVLFGVSACSICYAICGFACVKPSDDRVITTAYDTSAPYSTLKIGFSLYTSWT